ncbi:phage tail assembly chaperone [Paracoccus sp. IB05]|uniref:phage tail assembly chaperone n=1 Tax=Paracoccus sp. IB05 TaxID=2779367 RepID=UPI0018E71DCD|nr:phage tail assembly chaperone [Paracoccus sp. IB05]
MAELLEAHVKAGLDPQDFWSLTPREWAIRMDGAAAQLEAQRGLLAVSAWVGANTDKAGLERYIEGGNAEPHPPEALERMLMSASAGMVTMTMDQYLNLRRPN